MRTQANHELYNHKQSVEFYDSRYEQGYMVEWPIEKKRKIFEIIQSIGLPEEGEALDFGCGNGVLTEIVRQALPLWKIYGTDISNNAIANARILYPGCLFFEADSSGFTDKKFDFVFTNHVFEHVYNLDEVFGEMAGYMKSNSSMLHFLPCGNEGSFEYNVCLLRKDGISEEFEKRFFYEDEGHVRRLTTVEFSKLCQSRNFELKKAFYDNHYYGAIEWITSSNLKFVLEFTDSSRAVDANAKKKLWKLRLYLFSITLLRLPVKIVSTLMKKRNKQFKHYLLLIAGLFLWLLSVPIDIYWKKRKNNEWVARRFDCSGSEMCLYFVRN